MSLRFEVTQLRSDVVNLRREFREGIAKLLDAMMGQHQQSDPKRHEGTGFGSETRDDPQDASL